MEGKRLLLKVRTTAPTNQENGKYNDLSCTAWLEGKHSLNSLLRGVFKEKKTLLGGLSSCFDCSTHGRKAGVKCRNI